MNYKVWDIVKLSITTNHTPYPQRIKEILMRDNSVRIVSIRANGDCDVYIDNYGAFFVYADEILCPTMALFI